MFSRILSAAIIGIEVIPVNVEADVSDGLPTFSMVGCLTGQVREAEDRVRTSLRNIGVAMPPKRITINMSPADILKTGSRFDLPVALGVLCASGFLPENSLGGVMAADFAARHPGAVDALVLLAAYSTADLSQSGVRVLSVYGTEDGVLQRDKYESYRANLPAGLTELPIEGGCHAWFGSYGPQNGDGAPSISADQQQTITAEAVSEFLIP
jgi:hypothetical protein